MSFVSAFGTGSSRDRLRPCEGALLAETKPGNGAERGTAAVDDETDDRDAALEDEVAGDADSEPADVFTNAKGDFAGAGVIAEAA